MDGEEIGMRVGAFFGILMVEMVFGAVPLLMRRFIRSTHLRDRLLSLGNAFAGGLFLAGGFVHLLREAEETFAHELGADWEIPFGVILCPVGFGLAFFVEKVLFLRDPVAVTVASLPSEKQPFSIDETPAEQYGSVVVPKDQEAGHAHEHTPPPHHHHHPGHAHGHHHHHAPVHHDHAHEHHHHHHHGHGHHDHHHHDLVLDDRQALLPYILIAVLSLHSIIAGVALGIQQDFNVALSIFVALISHKWIEAFALGVSLLKAGKQGLSFFKFLMLFAIMCPLGILLGSGLYTAVAGSTAGELTTAVLTAIASGTFVYVAIVDILLEEFQTARDKYIKFLLAVVGFAAMASLLFAFDHDHGGEDEDADHSHSR